MGRPAGATRSASTCAGRACPSRRPTRRGCPLDARRRRHLLQGLDRRRAAADGDDHECRRPPRPQPSTRPRSGRTPSTGASARADLRARSERAAGHLARPMEPDLQSTSRTSHSGGPLLRDHAPTRGSRTTAACSTGSYPRSPGRARAATHPGVFGPARRAGSYVATDQDCVNVVFRGAVVGSPAYRAAPCKGWKITARQVARPPRLSTLDMGSEGERWPRRRGVHAERVGRRLDELDRRTDGDLPARRPASGTAPGRAAATGQCPLVMELKEAAAGGTSGGFRYRDLELPQDACRSGRVMRFGKSSDRAWSPAATRRSRPGCRRVDYSTPPGPRRSHRRSPGTTHWPGPA